MHWFSFLMISLVTWRITHLLSKEDGPFDIIFLLRKKAGAGFFGSLLDCFYCVSVWVAFPFGIVTGNDWWEKLLYWWAFSGAACLLEQATTNKKNKEENIPDYKED
ncbi:DUF1360 domain-containing protein [Ferruginibacter sp. SUN106]|uniref:DUF1360 domain-containing protein n=1 Tax=Ferruginibacter sp. SUN106 TaxID=2978348 RepID=UPI003D360492